MPLDEIAGGVLRLFLWIVYELVLETLFYFTGKLLIWFFTLGRFHTSPRKCRFSRRNRRPDITSTSRNVDADLAVLIGALFWIGLIVIYFTLK